MRRDGKTDLSAPAAAAAAKTYYIIRSASFRAEADSYFPHLPHCFYFVMHTHFFTSLFFLLLSFKLSDKLSVELQLSYSTRVEGKLHRFDLGAV